MPACGWDCGGAGSAGEVKLLVVEPCMFDTAWRCLAPMPLHADYYWYLTY
jgi:hypothetical protein